MEYIIKSKELDFYVTYYYLIINGEILSYPDKSMGIQYFTAEELVEYIKANL